VTEPVRHTAISRALIRRYILAFACMTAIPFLGTLYLVLRYSARAGIVENLVLFYLALITLAGGGFWLGFKIVTVLSKFADELIALAQGESYRGRGARGAMGAMELEQTLDRISERLEGSSKELTRRTHALEVTYQRLRELQHAIEQANKMRADFITRASHEIRTPLANIKGYTSLLLDGDVGELLDKQREFVEIVGANCERLAFGLNALIDISNLETGVRQIESQQVNLAEEIAAAAREIFGEGASAKLHLELDASEECVGLDGDRELLRRVFKEIFDNAVKHAPPGSPVKVVAYAADDFVRVTVQDHGRGISEDELQRIFDKFYQTETSAALGIKGLGLGLSIVRTILEKHGGEITAHSEEGEGCVFSMALPRHRRDKAFLSAFESRMRAAQETRSNLTLLLLQLTDGYEMDGAAWRSWLRRVVRERDYFCKYKNDTIAFICDTGKDGAARIAERLEKAAAEELEPASYRIVSATFPDDGATKTLLLQQAESRLRGDGMAGAHSGPNT